MPVPKAIRVKMPVQAVYIPFHVFPGKQMLWFNSARVKELIDSMKLTPFSAVGVGPWNGGNKALHLHYQEQVYMLTDKHWAEISTMILKDIQVKLENVKEIGFEEGVTLASMFTG